MAHRADFTTDFTDLTSNGKADLSDPSVPRSKVRIGNIHRPIAFETWKQMLRFEALMEIAPDLTCQPWDGEMLCDEVVLELQRRQAKFTILKTNRTHYVHARLPGNHGFTLYL